MDWVRVRDYKGDNYGLPASWTSLRKIDDFERMSDGRSLFRPDRLIRLSHLVDGLLNDDQK